MTRPARGALRSFLALPLVLFLALAVVLAGPNAPAAQALHTEGKRLFPASKVVGGASAARPFVGLCGAGPVAAALCLGGTVACIVWCDDAITWIDQRTSGQQSNEGYLGKSALMGDQLSWCGTPPGPDLSEGINTSPWCIRIVPVIGSGNSGRNHGVDLMANATCRSGADGSIYTIKNMTAVSSQTLRIGNPSASGTNTNFRNPCASGDYNEQFSVWTSAACASCGSYCAVGGSRCGGAVSWMHAPGPTDAYSRTSTMTVYCKRPDGTTFTVTATGSGGSVMPPDCAESDPRNIRTRVKVVDDATDEIIADESIDPNLFPDCMGNTSCHLDIWVDNQVCTDSRGQICTKWYEDPDGLRAAEPSRWVCRYGPYTVAMSDCEAPHTHGGVREKYQPTATPTPSPTATSTASPGPSSTASPGPTSTASASPTSSPGPTPGGPGQPDPADAEGNSCWPSGWGVFNPLEWIYRPVICALDYVFVPQEPVIPKLETAMDVWKTKAPFSIVGYAPNFNAALGLGGEPADCPPWVVKVGTVQKEVLCGTPYGNAIVSLRPVFTAFFVAMAVMPLIRSVWYSAFPVIKPVPH